MILANKIFHILLTINFIKVMSVWIWLICWILLSYILIITHYSTHIIISLSQTYKIPQSLRKFSSKGLQTNKNHTTISTTLTLSLKKFLKILINKFNKIILRSQITHILMEIFLKLSLLFISYCSFSNLPHEHFMITFHSLLLIKQQ
jgi:hypothetical protein